MKRLCFFSALALLAALLVSCKSTQEGSGIQVNVSPEIRVQEAITLRLNEPFSFRAQEDYEAVIRRNLSLSPQVDYALEVLNDQTLCLRPTAPLAYNSTYKVALKVGKITGNGKQTVQAEVKTLPPFFLFKDGSLEVDPEQEDRFMISGSIELSDPVEAKYIEEGFSVDRSGVTLAWTHAEDGRTHRYTLRGITPSASASQLCLTRNYPVSGRPADKRVYALPAQGAFSVVSAEALLEPYRIEVVFSALLDKKQSFAEVVKVPGGGKVKYQVTGNKLVITPGVKAATAQKVEIASYLKSHKNASLAQDWSRVFPIPSSTPSVKLLSKGEILPSSSGMNIYFQSVNYAKTRVRARRIYENNVLQYLQGNTLKSKHSYVDMVSRVVLDTTLVLDDPASPQLRNLHNYSLNLSELIKPQRGAIYKIELRGVEPLAELPEDYYESEYNFGSYQDYEDRTTNLIASDLGVIVKGSDKGDYTFAVTNLLDVSPVAGASVKVYNNVNQLIGEGQTQKDGLLTLSFTDEPHTAVVAYKEDKTYVKLVDGIALSLSNFEVGGQAMQKGQNGFIFGERGVWRPGDDIYLTFISMMEEGMLPANHPVTAALFNPQRQVVRTLTATAAAPGMYAFHFETEANAPTGDWLVEVEAGGVKYTKTLKVETIKPNKILMSVDIDDDHWLNPKSIQGVTHAKWLVGLPAKGLKTQLEVRLRRAATAFAQYKDYVFEDGSRGFVTETHRWNPGMTDADGDYAFNIEVPTSREMPGVVEASFMFRVFEAGGDFSTHYHRAKISPYETYLGLSFPEEENAWGEQFLDCQKTHQVKLVALNPQGEPRTLPLTVGVEVYKMGWNWWWNGSYAGLASYAKDSYNQPYKTFNTTLKKGVGSFDLDLSGEENGYYFVRVVDPTGGHATSKVVLSSTQYSWSMDESRESAAKLTMALDKPKYKTGETAQLTIPSAPGARALVSIEKGQTVLKTFWVDCAAEQTTISLPLDGQMAPNVYAAVTLVQPHHQSLNDAPIRLFGVQRIEVEDEATFLHPVIAMQDQVEPETENTLTVSEQNGKPMSYVIALVDEGLLSLTQFKTPDPWNHFYATEALGVRTWDIYNSVIGAYGARMEKLFAIGGDGESGLLTPPTQAERFKPVAMYLGPFSLKANQKEKHSITLPPYIGQLRVMVVATDGRAQGSAQKNVEVSKPVMVQATLPRVLRTEEEIRLPVTVFTTQDNLGPIEVEVKAQDKLSVVGSAKQTLTQYGVGEQVLYFTLKASDRAGTATLLTTAQCTKDNARETLEIDVQNPNPPTTTSQVVLLEAGKSFKGKLALTGLPGSNTAKIEASTLAPADLDFRLGYLLRYPHGCVEQTVSAAFPQLYLQALTQMDEAQLAKTEAHVKAALAKLPQYATASGGLTYWPAGDDYQGSPSFWGTAYAVHFMHEARTKGYALPTRVWENAVRYLKDRVGGNNDYSATEKAYALYVLALAGEGQRGAMNRMRETLTELPLNAGWFLASAYAADNKREIARGVLETMATKGKEKMDPFSPSFDSEDRFLALTVMTYNVLGEKAKAFEGVMQLAQKLNDRKYYMSTQSTAWALNALAAYASQAEATGVQVSGTCNGAALTLQSDKTFASAELSTETAESLALELTNKGTAPAYVVLSTTGIPPKGEEVAQTQGLQLTVRYTTPGGEAIDPTCLAQGTDFFVTAVVRNLSTTTDYTHLALSQLFPSGWEFERERSGEDYQDFRDDRVYSYFDLPRTAVKTFRIRATATYAGRYYLPSTLCEAMYDNRIQASTQGTWCEVQ